MSQTTGPTAAEIIKEYLAQTGLKAPTTKQATCQKCGHISCIPSHWSEKGTENYQGSDLDPASGNLIPSICKDCITVNGPCKDGR